MPRAGRSSASADQVAPTEAGARAGPGHGPV